MNHNCSNLLDQRNLQKQVKKAVNTKNYSDLSLFEQFVLVISKILQILGLQPRISKVFHTVGQNNFGNKILIFQGSDETGGASFSFGCTFNTHNKTCKYALSQHAHKFEKVSKNGDPNEQSEVAKAVNKLADDVSPFCKIYAPESYKNMIGMYLLRLKRL